MDEPSPRSTITRRQLGYVMMFFSCAGFIVGAAFGMGFGWHWGHRAGDDPFVSFDNHFISSDVICKFDLCRLDGSDATQPPR